MKNCPDLTTIISYSSGALGSSFATLVSSHIEKCEHCKKNIEQCHEMGGGLLESTEDNSLASNSYAIFLDKLKESENATRNTAADSYKTQSDEAHGMKTEEKKGGEEQIEAHTR